MLERPNVRCEISGRSAPRMRTMSVLDNREWFTFAHHNSSISLATLCLASLNQDRQHQLPASPLTIHYRLLSMRCLQKELDLYANTDSNMQRETMAGTVSILTMIEVMARRASQPSRVT